VDAVLDRDAPHGVGEAAVASHLADCARCQVVADSLRQVRLLLRQEAGRVPAPPADLGARLDAVLARAASAPALRAAEVGAGDPPVGDIRPDRATSGTSGQGWLGRRAPRWVAVAAGAAVLGGAALAAAQLGPDDGSGTLTAAPAEEATGTRAATGPAVAAVATGTDYTATALAAQVTTLLTGSGGGGQAAPDALGSVPLAPATPGRPGAAPAAAGTMTDPAGLRSCLDAIGAAGVTPLAVDLASYEGQQAAVVVLPVPGAGPVQVEVWVVARDCRPGADGLRQYQRIALGEQVGPTIG